MYVQREYGVVFPYSRKTKQKNNGFWAVFWRSYLQAPCFPWRLARRFPWVGLPFPVFLGLSRISFHSSFSLSALELPFTKSIAFSSTDRGRHSDEMTEKPVVVSNESYQTGPRRIPGKKSTRQTHSLRDPLHSHRNGSELSAGNCGVK
jgi:hypothetical protein